MNYTREQLLRIIEKNLAIAIRIPRRNSYHGSNLSKLQTEEAYFETTLKLALDEKIESIKTLFSEYDDLTKEEQEILKRVEKIKARKKILVEQFNGIKI